MTHRALSSSAISFGLVSIPVELFPATSSKSIHFNLLHAKDNSRIQEKIYCLAENKIVDRAELVHGFPIAKGEYVSFTNEELKRIEAGVSREIGILEFVPIEKVDPVYFAGSYLLRSKNGSAKAYHLLTAAMRKTGQAAIAKFVMRNKEHLVLIRPYRHVLMLHTMHYADEIRSADEARERLNASIPASELKLAEQLISDLSKSEFKADQFKDTYRDLILEMAKQKAAGREVVAPRVEKRGKVIDLMSALRESLKSGRRLRPVTADEDEAKRGSASSHKKTTHRRLIGSRGTLTRRSARS